MTSLLYIITFAILVVTETAFLALARRMGLLSRVGVQSSHSRDVVHGGGVVFVAALLCWAAFTGWTQPLFMAGALMLAAVSFIDDFRSLGVTVRLVTQFAAVGLALAQMMPLPGLTWPLAALLAVVAVGAVNVYNFMDGIDGMAGGMTLITLSVLIAVNATTGFISMPLLVCMAMAAAVFCFCNFRTRALCFAGDVGSITSGFVIIYALGCLIAATGSWLWTAMLAVYGVDAVMTIGRRLIAGQNILRPHRMHLYQYLCNERGYRHLTVSAAYAGVQLVIDLGALAVAGTAAQYWYLGATVAALVVAYAVTIRKG